jgi:hypothetical protein
MDLLGRLQGIFENPDVLERSYGLRQLSESVLDSIFRACPCVGYNLQPVQSLRGCTAR